MEKHIHRWLTFI